VALAFSQPLLNRGRINANIKASSAREQEALSQYDSNILTALEQVESTLAAQRGELARAEQLQASLMARQRSRQHAESLYREGQTGLMPLLELQRGVLAAELAVVDSRQQQLFNMVQLYQTLGGGWESFSPDLAQRAQQSTAPAVVNLFPVVSAPQGGQP
jgi:outer membrane protein TolC